MGGWNNWNLILPPFAGATRSPKWLLSPCLPTVVVKSYHASSLLYSVVVRCGRRSRRLSCWWWQDVCVECRLLLSLLMAVCLLRLPRYHTVWDSVDSSTYVLWSTSFWSCPNTPVLRSIYIIYILASRLLPVFEQSHPQAALCLRYAGVCEDVTGWRKNMQSVMVTFHCRVSSARETQISLHSWDSFTTLFSLEYLWMSRDLVDDTVMNKQFSNYTLKKYVSSN